MQKTSKPSLRPCQPQLPRRATPRLRSERSTRMFLEEVRLAMRRTIARRLVEAKQTIPHFYLVADVDIDFLLKVREGANAAQPLKISINDFVIKVFALALQRSGRQRRVGRGFHSALQALRCRRRRGDRRALHAGDSQSRNQVAFRDLGGDRKMLRRLRPRAQTSAARVFRRRRNHFKPGHVRSPRILRHHQSAAIDDTGSRGQPAPRGGNSPTARLVLPR